MASDENGVPHCGQFELIIVVGGTAGVGLAGGTGFWVSRFLANK
jgi:hypothetical protein